MWVDRGGRGLVVCRTPERLERAGVSNVGGASFGFQIGVEATDYVMLFMTPDSARSLLQSNIKLGGNVSVAAGPIGREAGAATDLKLNAQILSYSRSKGLFAGAALEGAVIETAERRHARRLRAERDRESGPLRRHCQRRRRK